MKILHVIQSYPPDIGGSETWCRQVAVHAARQGHQVRVYTTIKPCGVPPRSGLGRADAELPKQLMQDGVEVHRFARSRCGHHLSMAAGRLLARPFGVHCTGPHSLGLYRALPQATQWADIVHLHTVPYPHVVVGHALACLARKPVVLTPHFHIGHALYERRVFYALMRRCDQVLVMSERERQHLLAHRVAPDRLHLIGNGIDPSEYAQSDAVRVRTGHQGRRIVLFLGRKEPYKGLATLLEAFQRLKANHPSVALHLIGPRTAWFVKFWRDYPADLKRDVIEQDAVSHPDKVEQLRLADVLVLPSRFEAFGIVLLESWICGTPVVVPAATAPAEIAPQGSLTFRLDDAEDLARQLRRLFEDPASGRQLAEAGRWRVLERYTVEQIGAATLQAYQRILPQAAMS